MSSELVFESKLSYLVLRQEGAVETEAVISLQLELSGGPQIYASDASIINNAAWSMTVRRHSMAQPLSAVTLGSLKHSADANKTRCVIEVHQSPERFAALLDMFKGGHASEITVVVDGLTTLADYSKKWDTASGPSMAIKAIGFEFPLPQSDG